MKKLDCYLRTQRRGWGFSQREVAFLLGFKDRSLVSRLELNKQNPNLKAAFGCEVLFGEAGKELFPRFYTKIQDDFMRRAKVLHTRLQREGSPEASKKLDLLDDALKRARKFTNEQEV